MKTKRWLLIFGVIGILTHLLVLMFAPYVMMAALNLTIYKNVGYAEMLVKPQAVAGEDVIVRTSPDLLYSICAFNLWNGDSYRISAPPSDSYMSMSMFAHNTDNFFTINDLQSPEGIDIVLAKKGTTLDLPKGVKLIETGTPYGIILFRYYLGDKRVDEFDIMRNQAKCKIIKFD